MKKVQLLIKVFLSRFLVFIILFLSVTNLQAQCPPFWNDILAFQQKDHAAFPPKNAILFVGSSSFAKWQDVQDYFPGYTIINRGFGGSTLLDVIRYSYDIILPYQPKQIVIYCGENDLASSDTVSVEDVVKRFKTLYAIIRQNMPQVQVNFISLKPSPSRSHLMPKMEKANQQIQNFLIKEKNAGFINVYPFMLDEKGNPRSELFVEDRLHMKPAGYALWKKIITPFLIK